VRTQSSELESDCWHHTYLCTAKSPATWYSY